MALADSSMPLNRHGKLGSKLHCHCPVTVSPPQRRCAPPFNVHIKNWGQAVELQVGLAGFDEHAVAAPWQARRGRGMSERVTVDHATS